MDAHLWHQHARAPQTPAPEKLSLAELRALTPTEREMHASALREWLVAAQFPTASTRRVAATMSDVISSNSSSSPGAKTIVAVDALNTVGKSTAVRAWSHDAYREWIGSRVADAHLPRWAPEPGVHAHEVPIAWINLQSAARIRDFNAQILTYFGYPTEGPIRSLSTRITGAIGRHRVRVLVVDDVHLLDTRFKDGREVLDHLKHVNTELGERGATMVLVGAKLHDSPILSDPQIAGRLRVLELTPFGVDTLEEKRRSSSSTSSGCCFRICPARRMACSRRRTSPVSGGARRASWVMWRRCCEEPSMRRSGTTPGRSMPVISTP